MTLWLLARNQPIATMIKLSQPCLKQLEDVMCDWIMKSYLTEARTGFFVETYTTSSHKPDKNKVTAFTKMSAPTNKDQVQSFIGMANYLSKFSTRLSEIAQHIRELAKDKVPFNWGPEHPSASTQMKKEIASAPILAYYNPKKQTVLQTDASIKGLGVNLLQEEKPVYFASKDLTDAQWGYIAIELESLAAAQAM